MPWDHFHGMEINILPLMMVLHLLNRCSWPLSLKFPGRRIKERGTGNGEWHLGCIFTLQERKCSCVPVSRNGIPWASNLIGLSNLTVRTVVLGASWHGKTGGRGCSLYCIFVYRHPTVKWNSCILVSLWHGQFASVYDLDAWTVKLWWLALAGIRICSVLVLCSLCGQISCCLNQSGKCSKFLAL